LLCANPTQTLRSATGQAGSSCRRNVENEFYLLINGFILCNSHYIVIDTYNVWNIDK